MKRLALPVVLVSLLSATPFAQFQRALLPGDLNLAQPATGFPLSQGRIRVYRDVDQTELRVLITTHPADHGWIQARGPGGKLNFAVDAIPGVPDGGRLSMWGPAGLTTAGLAAQAFDRNVGTMYVSAYGAIKASLTSGANGGGRVFSYDPTGLLNVRMGNDLNQPKTGIVDLFGPGNPKFLNLRMSGQGQAQNSGMLTTFDGTQAPLVRLTSPGGSPDAGRVEVFDQGVLTAGIDGSTGEVFGAVKTFIQPHPADPTLEIRYVALEGPENGVYFRGRSRLIAGEARIEVPEDFGLVASEEGVTVQVTPRGPSLGLYIQHQDLAEIVIRENPGGVGDVAFDYHVMGVRSALPAFDPIRTNTHFTAMPGTRIPDEGLPGSYRELMIRNGTLRPDGTVDEAIALEQGWRLQAGRWSHPHREPTPEADPREGTDVPVGTEDMATGSPTPRSR